MMEYTRNEQAWVWLSTLQGMSPGKFYRLLAEAESAGNVYDCPDDFRMTLGEKLYARIVSGKQSGEAEALFDRIEKLSLKAVTRDSDAYPECLQSISDPPPTLFIKGEWPDSPPDKPFAVVGTRRPSYDGKKAAAEFASGLAENGVTIISGLALGIDAIAQSACLKAGGRTAAVLGNGLSAVYPKENEALAQRILENGGCLISELAPDEPPSRWTFPARNRIIAGLADGALIVEGDRKSGSLITADFAVEDGREVFAIPGSIYSTLSEGPNHLIQNGAYPAVSYWDILEAMRWGTRPGTKAAAHKQPELDENEKRVYDLLKIEVQSFDDLENNSGFSTSTLNYLLTTLELRGIIIKLPGNLFRLV